MSAIHRRTTATLLAGAIALTAAAPTLAHGDEPRTRTPAEAHSRAGAGAEMAQLRKDLAKYQDVDVAIEAGYIPASPCEESPAGGMGFHYVNFALMGSIDPKAPAILLYEPTADGGLELAGVEWFAADADQDLTTDGDRPNLWGRDFDGPMPGHSPQMPIHYDLHVWLYEANPAGVFEPWNPNVTC